MVRNYQLSGRKFCWFKCLGCCGTGFFPEIVLVAEKVKWNQPALLSGKGTISFGKSAIGVWPSPFFLNGYAHIEARCEGSEVIVGTSVHINNSATIIADKTRVVIGDDCLIGPGLFGSSLFRVGNGMKGVHPTLEVFLHYES